MIDNSAAGAQTRSVDLIRSTGADKIFAHTAWGYAQRGWRVLPLHWITEQGQCSCLPAPWAPKCASAGKHPLEADWPTTGSTDPHVIVQWWVQYPQANVGIATGEASGLFVVDIDPKSGGEDSWERLRSEYGESEGIPETHTVRTGSKGLHYYFKHPGAVVKGTAKAFGDAYPGIDLRGKGGLVVAPPSVSDKGPYEVVTDLKDLKDLKDPEDIEDIGVKKLPPAPKWLLNLMSEHGLWYEEGSAASNGQHPGPAGGGRDRGEEFDWDRALTPGAVPIGEQDDTLMRAAASLRARGVTDSLALPLLRRVVEYFTNDPAEEPWTPAHADKKWAEVKTRYADGTELPPWAQTFVDGLRPDAAAEGAGDPATLAMQVANQVGIAYPREKALRKVRRRLDEEELAEARGPRPKRTARVFATETPPAQVIQSILAAEVNLLGGPSAAGKSLLARDWALAVASGMPWEGHPVPEARNVLYVASEGTHDFVERWASRPLWEAAADRIFVLDEPVNLVSASDTDWLIEEYGPERPGLIIFDVIYGMGLPDDNGTKDVGPLINSLKRVSKTFGGATLALGHPGHGGSRRFRGWSGWQQLAAAEWHLADGTLTCEKSKIADASRLTMQCSVGYPELTWLSGWDAGLADHGRKALIRADIEQNPDDSTNARSKRLARVLGKSESYTWKLVKRAMEDLQVNGKETAK